MLCSVATCSNKELLLLLAEFNMGLMGPGRSRRSSKKAAFLWNVCGLMLCVGVCYVVTPFGFRVSQSCGMGEMVTAHTSFVSLSFLQEQIGSPQADL